MTLTTRVIKIVVVVTGRSTPNSKCIAPVQYDSHSQFTKRIAAVQYNSHSQFTKCIAPVHYDSHSQFNEHSVTNSGPKRQLEEQDVIFP